ncbi:MAG: HAD family hydrolase [Candidimonas sp.]|nr:HAD family hydrolase [Candidimonas sp.]
MISVDKYKTFVFDCDGVVLNSNRVKTLAFYQAALPYGEKAAQALVDYHTANGGVSRYKKFSFFLQELVPAYSDLKAGPAFDELLASYASEVYQGLLECEMAPGLLQLREQTADSRWLVVSGGDQCELRDVFARRNLRSFFDGGIYGSPDTKDQILARELARGNIRFPAIFLGDSKYDQEAAIRAGLEFIFLSDWTEVKDWEDWAVRLDVSCLRSVKDLIRT